MTREEFSEKISDLLQAVDLTGYEFLNPREEVLISDELNKILNIIQ